MADCFQLSTQERFERDIRVGQGRRVGPRALLHEHAGKANIARVVEGIRSDDEPATQIECGELMARQIAAYDEPIPALGQTDHL